MVLLILLAEAYQTTIGWHKLKQHIPSTIEQIVVVNMLFEKRRLQKKKFCLKWKISTPTFGFLRCDFYFNVYMLLMVTKYEGVEANFKTMH